MFKPRSVVVHDLVVSVTEWLFGSCSLSPSEFDSPDPITSVVENPEQFDARIWIPGSGKGFCAFTFLFRLLAVSAEA